MAAAAAAAELHGSASMLLSGGEGQRKFQTGASSPQIIVEGWRERQGDMKTAPNSSQEASRVIVGRDLREGDNPGPVRLVF